MSTIFKELKGQIVEALQAKAPNIICPVCKNSKFTLVDAYLVELLQDDFTSLTLGGGPSIPTVGILCNNCGYLMKFSIGVLGLLPKKGTDTENKNEKK